MHPLTESAPCEGSWVVASPFIVAFAMQAVSLLSTWMITVHARNDADRRLANHRNCPITPGYIAQSISWGTDGSVAALAFTAPFIALATGVWADLIKGWVIAVYLVVGVCSLLLFAYVATHPNVNRYMAAVRPLPGTPVTWVALLANGLGLGLALGVPTA